MENLDLEFMIQVNHSTAEQAFKMVEGLKKEPGGWVLEAIEKHFSARNLACDDRVKILILYFFEGIIGKCVRAIETCQKWAFEVKKQEITLDDFNLFIMPRLSF